MAMTMKAEGMEELSEILTKLGEQAEAVASAALYEGAGVMADAFTKAIGEIRTEPHPYNRRKGRRFPYPEEVEALNGKVGIAKFQKNGSEVNTVIGIQKDAGYTTVNGRKKPVAVIARSINSGTSFMKKQPVFRKAARTAQGAAMDAMTATGERLLKEIIGE